MLHSTMRRVAKLATQLGEVTTDGGRTFHPAHLRFAAVYGVTNLPTFGVLPYQAIVSDGGPVDTCHIRDHYAKEITSCSS